jgi:hypothetical protein
MPDAWVGVVGAAVGVVPGLVFAWFSARSAARQLDQNDLRSSAARFITEAMTVTQPLVFYGTKEVRAFYRWRPSAAERLVLSATERLRPWQAAKTELDLLTDLHELHAAADELLAAAVNLIELATSSEVPTSAALESAQARQKAARLTMLHETRRLVPPRPYRLGASAL